LTQIESLLPVNDWEITPKVEIATGVYQGDELILTGMQKTTEAIKAKAREPRNQIAMARLKKKAAVTAAQTVISQLGIDLNAIFGDVMELFGIDMPEVDLNAKVADMEVDIFEPLSDEELALLETGTAEFKSTAIARFCRATENTKVPVKVEWHGPVENAKVKFWRFDKKKKRINVDKPIEVALTAKKAKKDGEKAPENQWEGTVNLAPGRWAYTFDVDGKQFYGYGDAIPEGKEGCYKVLEVICIEPHFV